ncbi:dysbindin-like [Clavelina lepadiformis]|uniref:dysbindin-like n=1 Tax=Clavelina lepadiformis TaxID=159417 RepID=UPI004041FB6D
MNFFQTTVKKPKEMSEEAFNAGAELLHKFQTEWEQIHSNSVQAGHQEKELSKLIQRSQAEWKQMEEMFAKFCSHLHILPQLLMDVDKLAEAIGNLDSAVEEVTCAVDLYEKVCLEQKQCRGRQEELQHVNELRIAKRQELEKMKELLAGKHASTLSKLRAKQATLTTERQDTLEQAIDSDLDPDLPI